MSGNEKERTVIDNLREFFVEHQDEYLKFDRIKDKLSQRPDLHAFLLLDRLVPGTHDMVSAAEHDEVWLDVDPEKLCTVATEEQLIDLHRCGVRCFDGSLCMFA
jgi:hypothetical protein